ncbi:amino acid adenylation domain-containing protein [Legionella sp. km772]|uniref:amino acid adenylation domain-containing protein n=1 Tax=Legionella sp. km772 TaxID=2498111 RepID=UPI000F8DD3C1|nr:amino acid adenylation domain-containing protein [Legionella sp. km772]RUR13891.1 amino acid adenylation domain-containing protein [Legionella sp. km772]
MFNHFIDAFLLAVKNYPHKTAIYFGEEQFTYESVHKYSDTLAHAISKLGLPKEAIIPLVLERTPNIIITMLGILKAGCAFLPISPSSPCSRIEYILEETKAKLAFCDSSIRFKIPEGLTLINPADLEISSRDYLRPNLTGENLAYVMYTSGSTGNPKGVLIEHHSMMNLFFSLIETLTLSEKDLFLALTDYTFDISLIELLMPLTLGAGLVLTEHGVVADGKKIKHYINQFNVTLMQATPLTWEILLKNGWVNDGAAQILVGGEQFKSSLAAKLNYEKGNIWNVYGPTETSMWSMIYNLRSPLSFESVPLGETVANTSIKLVDMEEPGQTELYIGGKGVARGYLNAPELTAKKFVTNEEGERFYKTGDLVTKTEDGALCYLGRADDQLKFGGIRIEAGEIEATIENEVFVKKAVVKIHEHNDYYKTLAAYVEMDEEALFAHGNQIISEDSSSYIEAIYDEVYTHAKEFEYEELNTCGWQNSFTGQIFNSEELSESYTTIRDYIQNADLTHVMEVGCGTGGLLLSYLPQAQQVTLVEVSNNALDYVRTIIPNEFKDKVSYKLESMINIHESYQFSCVIINSVLQYMPSVKSIVDSLKQLIKAIKPGGTLLIGDVRSLELLDVFLAMKYFHHHPDANEINPAHLYYKSRETEIVLSPLFFYALREQFKRISWVDINVKQGNYFNELNYFRYDVVLHIEKDIEHMECYHVGFNEFQEKELITRAPQPVKISNVPYDYLSRLCTHLSLQEKSALQNMLKSSSLLVEEKNNRSASLINQRFPGYQTFIHYQQNAPLHYLQLLLVPISSSNKLIRPIDKEKIDSFHPHCREPFSPWLQKFCFDHIKMNVKKHVMAWVNPSIYLWVEKWPQTINGKLDKKKLVLPNSSEVEQDNGSILSQLKQLWLNITGNHALITEEFWTHGVSSLSMYYFLATINETFHLHMTYHEFHQYNTMEKVANYIELLLASSFNEERDKDF